MQDGEPGSSAHLIHFEGVFHGSGASVQMERAEMGEPEGRRGIDGGSQGPVTRPGLCRLRVQRAARQSAKRKSARPEPVSNMEDRVTTVETRMVSVDQRLNDTIHGAWAVFAFDAASAERVEVQVAELRARSRA